jgi:hypothetical protein
MSGNEPTVDVEKALKALRTRIAETEAQGHAERLAMPGRLAAAAFAAAVFALTAVPWVTVGSERPKTYSLWGFVERVEGVSVFTLVVVLVLAGTALWAGCAAEVGPRVPVLVGVLTVLALILLTWLSKQANEEFGDRYDDSVEWWPAPWLLAICAVGALAAVAARKQR